MKPFIYPALLLSLATFLIFFTSIFIVKRILNPDTFSIQKYQNAKYSFEFNFPPKYDLSERTIPNGFYYISLNNQLSFNKQDTGLKIEIYISKSPRGDSIAYLAKETQRNTFDKGRLLSQSPSTLGNTPAIYQEWSDRRGKSATILTIHNGLRYQLTKFPLKSTRETEFDQILSTFKFLETPNLSQTYTNSTHGFQLVLPPGWSNITDDGNFNSSKGDYQLVVSVNTTPYKTIQSFLQWSDDLSQTAYEGYPSLQVLSTKITKINNYSVIQRQEKFLAAGFSKPVISTYFLNQGQLYSVQLRYLGTNPTPDPTGEGDYNSILSSFKFTN